MEGDLDRRLKIFQCNTGENGKELIKRIQKLAPKINKATHCIKLVYTLRKEKIVVDEMSGRKEVG